MHCPVFVGIFMRKKNLFDQFICQKTNNILFSFSCDKFEKVRKLISLYDCYKMHLLNDYPLFKLLDIALSYSVSNFAVEINMNSMNNTILTVSLL